jgi:nicotinic acid phosphoribosyltransferase
MSAASGDQAASSVEEVQTEVFHDEPPLQAINDSTQEGQILSIPEIADGNNTQLYIDFITRAGELSNKDSTITILVKGEGAPKTFIQVLNEHPAFASVIKKFNYPSLEDTLDTSTVVEVAAPDKPLINAFFANDLYKLSMAPVIHHVTSNTKGCTVQFKVDLRIKSNFNEDLKSNYVMNEDSSFVNDLVKELYKFKDRLFDEKIFDSLMEPLKDGNPTPIWKDSNKFLYTLIGRPLIAEDREDIKKFYNNISGVGLSNTDFYDNTCILTCIPIPINPSDKNPVVLSVLFNNGVEGDQDDETKGPDIRATGFWPWCSWLETPLMQCAYEVMHQHYLKTIMLDVAPDRRNTYGAWMAESLFRTFTGINFLQKPDNASIKVALFSGRRTGGALFNLLQVYLWDKFDKPGYAVAGGRNLGTSSFWGLETLKNLGHECQILPSGTHAHELSMTLNVLYGKELDIPEIGFVGTQILGHLLYKELSAGKTPTPMLTDTVGTRNFLETAVVLKDPSTKKPALCSFSSARQDSGKLEDYVNIMKHYTTIAQCTMPLLMASEIDERNDDFLLASNLGYTLAGVGGALGDSEKIDSDLVLGIPWEKPIKVAFAASEAAKITRVWSGKDESGGYTLKTGDAIGQDKKDKVTFDKKANTDIVEELNRRADKFQDLQLRAITVLRNSSSGPEDLESFRFDKTFDGKPIEDIITEKQKELDDLLKSISNRAGGPSKQKLGGRRTRRRARKVTKKHVRKNIRKSKNKKSRRSYRRKSKK